MDEIYFLGKKGKLEGALTKDADVPCTIAEFVVESLFEPKGIFRIDLEINESRPSGQALDIVTKIYQKEGVFGPNGDLILVSIFKIGDGVFLRVNFIAQLCFPKPSMAADILNFVICPNGRIFFVGIVRKDNGEQALSGGFREVCDRVFQCGVEACIDEAKQETGIIIVPAESLLDGYRHKTTVAAAFFLGSDGPQDVRANIVFLGDYNTPEPQSAAFASKRVDETRAYAAFIELGQDVTPEELETWLKPAEGEDAKKVDIIEIVTFNERPDFGFDHHGQIFEDALRKLRGVVAERIAENEKA